MYKSYKFRLYPNKQQEELIQKTFGCCRFVYNYFLDYKIKKFKEEGEYVGTIDCNNYCNRILKKEYEWLREPDKNALTNSIKNLDVAYQMFFKKHNGYPKFKSKRDRYKSYTTNINNYRNIEVINNKIKLPKLKWVKIRGYKNVKIEGKIKSATISQVPSGKYFVSVMIEIEHKPAEHTGAAIGVDFGIKDLLITSDGERFDNIHTTKKYEKKLAKEQRRLSHKKKGSNNWDKQRIKVAKLHEKIADTRKDNLHKISHKLISENQVIVSEDLNVEDMLQNHNLSKSIFDCSWHELARQLAYKAEWNDRQYIKIDMFYPSSQLCSNCGYQNKDMKNLCIREWECPNCGKIHDRDINAAINILNEGLRLLKAS